AEMAPMRGEVLVLDEVQWAEDEERGSAWTRLMLGAEYRHILLLGAVEALPLVENAFPEAEIKFFERKAPLDWIGGRSIEGLRPEGTRGCAAGNPVGETGSGTRRRRADAAGRAAGRSPRLPDRRHGAAAATAVRSERVHARGARAGAAGVAERGALADRRRQLADGRVDRAAARAARRGARVVAQAPPEARRRDGLEADQRADRRGRRAAARRAGRGGRARLRRAAAAAVAARPGAAHRGESRGGGARRAPGRDPALVRAPVRGRRRRDAGEGCITGGGRRSRSDRGSTRRDR